MESKDAFGEGYDARFNDRDASTNPYDSQTDEHLSWNDGYNAADEELDEK